MLGWLVGWHGARLANPATVSWTGTKYAILARAGFNSETVSQSYVREFVWSTLMMTDSTH